MKRLFILTLFFISATLSADMVKAEVKVIDESRNPIEGANIEVRYLAYQHKNDRIVKGVTNAQGIFSTKKKAILHVEVTVEKEGFYKSTSEKLSRKKDHDLTFVLREKKNPIPLYAKRVLKKMPDINSFFAFDFEVGDWVRPHGVGEREDVFIKAVKDVKDRSDYKGVLTLKFNDIEEGLIEDNHWNIESKFHSTRIAPESGYMNMELIVKSRNPNKPGRGYENSRKKNYLMRTRVKRDSDGNIISANYGKIYGGINTSIMLIDPKGYQMEFTYYYNPIANDRNLEFDPQKNLFNKLGTKYKFHKP